MISNAFGLIYAGESNPHLKDLTLSRSIGAVPFGGRYRCIDFILSDMVNSGLTSVGVIAEKNYHSLMDHLGSGKEWDLHRKREGLYILPPFMTKDSPGVSSGSVGAIRSALGYARRAPEPYCILCAAGIVLNVDFTAMMEQHLASGADITMLYSDDGGSPEEEQRQDLRFVMDENRRIVDMELDPYRPQSISRNCDIMILHKDLLIYLINEAYARGEYDFKRDIILKKYRTLRILGFPYNGYLARLTSISNYFRCNMELLDRKVQEELFNPIHPIYTKVKDEVPAKYGPASTVKNSLLADGCHIEGRVENSILFRGVTVEKDAVVKNSIVMQGVTIQSGAALDHIILDKGVTILPGRNLVGYESFPIVIRKNQTV